MDDLPVFRRLRRLWLAFVLVVGGIMVALPVLDPEPSDIPVALPATLAAAGGLGAIVAIVAIELTFAASRPDGDLRALREYEARQTLMFAIAQAPAVLGFALAFAFGLILPAAIGGAMAGIALIRGRPSVTRLRRIEQAWQDAGHDVSALRAAADAPAAGRDGGSQPSPDGAGTEDRRSAPIDADDPADLSDPDDR